MSFAVVQNGEIRQILQLDVPFSVGDKHYSSNFLRTSSAQEKVEAGVWEIIEGNVLMTASTGSAGQMMTAHGRPFQRIWRRSRQLGRLRYAKQPTLYYFLRIG